MPADPLRERLAADARRIAMPDGLAGRVLAATRRARAPVPLPATSRPWLPALAAALAIAAAAWLAVVVTAPAAASAAPAMAQLDLPALPAPDPAAVVRVLPDELDALRRDLGATGQFLLDQLR
jgi:hypothetical protein